MKKRLNVRITEDLWNCLKFTEEKEGRSQTDIVERALMEFFGKNLNYPGKARVRPSRNSGNFIDGEVLVGDQWERVIMWKYNGEEITFDFGKSRNEGGDLETEKRFLYLVNGMRVEPDNFREKLYSDFKHLLRYYIHNKPTTP